MAIKVAEILVIDDDLRIKESLELSFPEYKFHGALSGEAGLKFLDKTKVIDLAILDCKMTGANGIDVLKKIKKKNLRIGVIMLTGYGDKTTVMEALQGHADDFVDKPYAVEEMKHKIESLLEARRAESKQSGFENTAVRKVIRMIERNYDKLLTLDDASAAAALSPKYVSRIFKKETRQSYTEFRIRMRIGQAKRLLESSALTVGEIAERVGYANTGSFAKIFKKISKLTPTEYREQKIHASVWFAR